MIKALPYNKRRAQQVDLSFPSIREQASSMKTKKAHISES